MDSKPENSALMQQLLEQAREGDHAAFEKLFAQFKLYLEALGRLHDYLKNAPMPFRLWLRRLALDRRLTSWAIPSSCRKSRYGNLQLGQQNPQLKADRQFHRGNDT